MSRCTLISLTVLCLILGAGVFAYLHAQSYPAPDVRHEFVGRTKLRIDVANLLNQPNLRGNPKASGS